MDKLVLYKRNEKNLLKILKVLTADIERIDRVLTALMKGEIELAVVSRSNKTEFGETTASLVNCSGSLNSPRDIIVNKTYLKCVNLDKKRIQKGSHKQYVC